ncbi:DUF4349 domain-containing protein [Actinomadura graeca]|uniref:DUF4349 domain-containing protein n=1 Tax=Actinomadura graeca TaxID=2750812 RepID=A0ABX8QQT0_9ACTN|nr:DUF4349 domain-containing protein [Actinomadura graeca]QXJ20554.1 DUF4349 domain-containing protein [Actinomadura graeca]
MACALVLLLLAGALAACSGGSSGGSSTSDSAGGGGDAAVSRNGAAPEATSYRSPKDGGGRTDAKVPLPPARSVVYTATLRVRADDVDASAAKAKQQVTAEGGYVEQETGTSTPPSSTLRLKIPADRYAGLLARLSSELGTKRSLSQQAEDVTGEVADVDSRVRSAQAALASFRKLLDKARTVGEVINVEQEIATREADLEALQARQKSLRESTRYATLTVELEARTPAAEDDEENGRGFAGGLRDGWDAFTAFAGGVATVLGWLLPFLVAAAVIGLPAVAVRRRLRGRRPAPAPGSAPPGGEERQEGQEREMAAVGPAGPAAPSAPSPEDLPPHGPPPR